jgi:hypothetical protein
MDDRHRATIDNIVNPTALIPNMPIDKIWMLLGEAEELLSDYERELSIAYLSCNHSEVKHLCTTILRGKDDTDIIASLTLVRDKMKEELNTRKKSKI